MLDFLLLRVVMALPMAISTILAITAIGGVTRRKIQITLTS